MIMRHAPPLAGTGAPPSPAGVRFIHTHISAHTMYGVRFYPTCSTMRRHLRRYPTCIHPHPENLAIKTGDHYPTTPTFTGAETFHYPFLAPRAPPRRPKLLSTPPSYRPVRDKKGCAVTRHGLRIIRQEFNFMRGYDSMLPDMVKQFSLLSDKTRGAPAASTCSLAAPAGCDERGDGSCADATAPGGDGDGAPVDVE
jgi:hypothetical protein